MNPRNVPSEPDPREEVILMTHELREHALDAFPDSSAYLPDDPHMVVVEHDGPLSLALCLTCEWKHPDTPAHAEAKALSHAEKQHYTRHVFSTL